MEQNNAWGETWKLEWQATIGQSLTLSVQHGRFEHVNQYTGFAAWDARGASTSRR